jgi:hypothetical protein
VRLRPPSTTGLRIRHRPVVRFEVKMKIALAAETVGGMAIEIGGGEGRSILREGSKRCDNCDSGSTQVVPPHQS